MNAVRFVKLLVSAAVFLFDSAVRLLVRLAAGKPAAYGTVIYYHRVADEDLRCFSRQMDILLGAGRPVSADFKGPLEDGNVYIAVTFDDGFQETMENIMPEMAKRKIPFTVFVPTGHMGGQAAWIHKGPGASEKIVDKSYLRKLSVNDLVSIGSHCVTHKNLLALPPQDAKDEISVSGSDLQALVGYAPKMISFPHGAYSEQHVEWAQKAGYTLLFGIRPGKWFPNTDAAVTCRVDVEPTDWNVEFYLKIIGAYRWLPAAYYVKRKIKGIGSFFGKSPAIGRTN